jgi:predicted transcriptional regulator of viral defense system
MAPTETPSQRKTALSLLERNGIMRLSDLIAQGVDPPTLSRLVNEGAVIRPSRGLYELAGGEFHLSHGLAEIAKRVPRGVICLISALQFHEITLQNASSVWVAIGDKDRKPTIDYPPVRFVRFGERALAAGIDTHIIDSVAVRITDPAKTVVDCFRYRKTVGLDVALEALRMALRSSKASPDQITHYARNLRIWTVIRPYLESLAADEG